MATVLTETNHGKTFSFSSQPQAITTRKCENQTHYKTSSTRMGHLMYDRRVIRGNALLQHMKPLEKMQNGPPPFNTPKTIERTIAEVDTLCPNPFTGRLNQPVQTELYLEELTDAVEETDVQCQTDFFLDRPPTPEYVPAKTGEDVATQIMEGDLFDFELEVMPILEVLIGKTVEQSLLEVMEEEELADLRAQQQAFAQLRQAERAEVERLLDQDRRLREEKERRRQQHAEAMQREEELLRKVTASVFAKTYLTDLVGNVYKTLLDRGYFYDPVERDIEEGFYPWLMEELDQDLQLEKQARMLLDQMIREIVDENHQAYLKLQELDAEKRKLADHQDKPEQIVMQEPNAAKSEQDETTEQGQGIEEVEDEQRNVDPNMNAVMEEDEDAEEAQNEEGDE